MAVALDPDTQESLDAGRIVDRDMILFDLGSGLYGFWTGACPLTWQDITFVGAGSLLSFDASRQVSDLSSVPLVVKLSSIPEEGVGADVLATIEAETYHQRPATVYVAYFDAETGELLSVEPVYRGIIDRIVHVEGVDQPAALEVYLESRSRDHQKGGYRMRSDTDQRRILSTDNGLRHVGVVATEKVLFGRVEQPPQGEQKKSWLQRLFD